MTYGVVGAVTWRLESR